jgi:hypothetical protein
MIEVLYPKPEFQIKEENGRHYIFDSIRKVWLLLTEEEWVRQCFVAYLVKELSYPVSLVALEKELILNDLKKRFDILVYDRQFQPWLLVECKAPKVSLNEHVLQQALRYNITVPVQYILLTNGPHTLGWQKIGDQLKNLSSMPAFPK